MKKGTKKSEMTIHLWSDGQKSRIIVESYPIDSKGHYVDMGDDEIVDEFPLSWRIIHNENVQFFINGKLIDPIFVIDFDDGELEMAIALADHLRSVLIEFSEDLKQNMNWLTPVTHMLVTSVDIDTDGWPDHLVSIVKLILGDIKKMIAKINDQPE